MEQATKDQSADQNETARDFAVITPAQGDVAGALSTSEAPCPSCAGAATGLPVSYVYAIGRIEARFPRLSVEKEFAQATGRAETAGQTDQEAFYNVLSKRTSCSPAIPSITSDWWRLSAHNQAPWTSMW